MELLFILGIALFLLSLLSSSSDSYGYRGHHRPHRSTVIMSDPYNDDRYDDWHYRQMRNHNSLRATIIFLIVLVAVLYLNR